MQPDISIFTLRELLSRLLAPAHSDMHAIPAEDELFPKEPGIRQSWNVTPRQPPSHTTHSLSFSTPPADHCQITICIIICSAQKRKLTPKFYGSTNCNNQCFIGYTKAKISLTIMVEELSFSPSSPFSINSIQLLYWHDCLSETIFPKQFKKCKFIPHPCLTKKKTQPTSLSFSVREQILFVY